MLPLLNIAEDTGLKVEALTVGCAYHAAQQTQEAITEDDLLQSYINELALTALDELYLSNNLDNEDLKEGGRLEKWVKHVLDNKKFRDDFNDQNIVVSIGSDHIEAVSDNARGLNDITNAMKFKNAQVHVFVFLLTCWSDFKHVVRAIVEKQHVKDLPSLNLFDFNLMVDGEQQDLVLYLRRKAADEFKEIARALNVNGDLERLFPDDYNGIWR